MYKLRFEYHDLKNIVSKFIPEILNDKKMKKINMEIFREALTHESARRNRSYERLEFLGDSLFREVMTRYLFERYPDDNEGFITKLRIKLEKGESMVELFDALEIERFVDTYYKIDDKMREDLFEAFIGAFYLTYGRQYSNDFIIKLIETYKDFPKLLAYDDNHKDIILRYFHKQGVDPEYKTVYNNGKYVSTIESPDKKMVGIGKGSSDKNAEQRASKMLLEELGIIENGEIVPKWETALEKKLKGKDDEKEEFMVVYNDENVMIGVSDVNKILNRYFIHQKGYDIKIFRRAMTHKSYVKHRNPSKEEKEIIKGSKCVRLQAQSNDNLKLLGETIFHFVLAEYLYNQYKDKDEGFMSEIRSRIENKNHIMELASKTGLTKYLLISQHLENIGSRENSNLMAGCFDAFVGAISLSCGIMHAQVWLDNVMHEHISYKDLEASSNNYKKLLIAHCNKKLMDAPKYKVLETVGPTNDRIFTIGLYLQGELVYKGKSGSIKSAEQLAAKGFLSTI